MKTLLVEIAGPESALRRCLCERGWELVNCGSLPEAKQNWTKEPVPLLVVNSQSLLPEIPAFCRWLRGRAGGGNCFVLVAMPGAALADLHAVIDAGADDVLTDTSQPEWISWRLEAAERQIQQRLEAQKVQDALNTRTQQQVLVAALGQCALSEVHQPKISNLLTLVTSFVMQMLEVEFCNVMEMSEDRHSLRLVAGLGWKSGSFDPSLAAPADHSGTLHTLMTEDTIVEDLAGDPRFSPGSFLHDHGVTGGITVVLRGSRSQALGTLGAWTAQKRTFSTTDLHFLQSLGHVLGAVIEQRRLQREVEHLQRLEAVGQLAAGLAHDYNNVLAIVHGHASRALGTPGLPPKLSDSLSKVLEAVERAAHLTRQLLTFSRKQPLQVKALDLNEVVGGFARLLDRVLGKDIQIEFRAGRDLPAIEADSGMLEQVLMNLAVNARDAISQNGKLIISTSLVTVSATRAQQHPEARAGDFACLSVADNGCGMDEATLHRIFEPFFSTKGPGKGTGLGLATVYGIVKQHQGWIEVESKRGRGTTFLVFFPCLNSTSASTMPAPVPAPQDSAAPDGHETVLLVEDEPSLRELARLLLEELGHPVLEAGSGADALQLWQDHRRDVRVLLTDVALPDGISGFELAERLQGEQPSLAVVLTSGYSPDEVRKGWANPARFHFLQKPYRTTALANVLWEALGAPKPEQPSLRG